MTQLKTNPLVDPVAIRRMKQTAYNPVRGLCPSNLATKLDDFQRGDLREAALLFDALRRRDDTLVAVTGKREKSVARKDWTVTTAEDSDRALLHKAVLESFYSDLTATRVDKLDQVGGIRTLVKNMMMAVGDEYSAHEIVWKALPADRAISVEGQNPVRAVSAEFRYVPLWFFETRTGKLRFKADPYHSEGVDMAPGQWLVTVGEGLMQASAIAYLFKVNPLQDWAIYSERHGMPAFLGKTDSEPGTPAWEAMEDAVGAISKEFAGVCKNGDMIEILQLAAQGELPYPKLVERMDRALATLWRGADLSTMSAGAGEGSGASLQGDETDLLEEDDCAMVEDALAQQVSRYVIEYCTGDREQLARLELDRPSREDTSLEMAIDGFLIDHGVPVSIASLRDRYGRSAPEDGEDLAKKATPALGGLPGGLTGGNPFANEAGEGTYDLPQDLDEAEDELLAKAVLALGKAQAEDLAPLRDRLLEIRDLEDPAAQVAALRELDARLAEFVTGERTAEVFAGILNAAVVNGAERSPQG